MLAQLVETPESMVVLGAEPTGFDGSLGYIHTQGEGGRVEVITSFFEKPDPATIDEIGDERDRSTGTPPATAYGSSRRATPTAPRCR